MAMMLALRTARYRGFILLPQYCVMNFQASAGIHVVD